MIFFRLGFFSLPFLFFWVILVPLPVPLKAIVIPSGEGIQEYIHSHPQEKIFDLEVGVYSGNLVIDRTLELRGTEGAVIRSSGSGTTIRVTAPGVKLTSLIVDGSGGRYDQKDAAVAIHADRVTLSDTHITGATFGIVVEQAQGVQLIGNRIEGNPDIPFGLRGDGIRIWETTDSLILSNQLIDSRDLVVWYASSNEFKYNQMREGRYGMHFMYSHYNHLAHNQFLSNIVGAFFMYSRHITTDHNLFAGTTGPSGYGLGIKESGNLTFLNNTFVANTVGIYSDNAPYDDREKNHFQDNVIAFSEIGIEFHGQPKRNVFQQNTFKKNRIQVKVSGQASAEEVVWTMNYFDDYQGYDMNKDGVGDIPYEYRRLINDLTGKYPFLIFFDGTPVYHLINLLGEALPLMRPRLIMSDPLPRMTAPSF